jgi:histidine kinase
MLSYIRRHLVAKLFLSYLAVILVGVAVLASTAEFAVPNAFDQHLSHMSTMMGMMGGFPDQLQADLYISFRRAVTSALTTAAVAAGGTAILASLFISRQVSIPIQKMTAASQRIAEGHYEERVPVVGNIAVGEQDELGILALSFNRMATKLEQTESMRSQLIGDVSHELRTPLTTIKGYMEGLIDEVLPATEETYQQIYREADRLQRLVNDLQELSRVEAGAYELHFQRLKISGLVRSVLQRFQMQFAEKGVDLQAQLPENIPPVWADVDRTTQVLINILGNALMYTPAGGQVRVSVRKIQGQIEIFVEDTGAGIAPEHLPHLFTRFYRADKSRSRVQGGSGIGLTVAKHLVEAQGGRIEADSKGAGKGSTFKFTLPIAS